MLRATKTSDAQRFRDFLREAGYTESGFRSRPALQQLPSRHAGNLPWLLESTAEPGAFNILARLFLFGLPQPAALAARAIPEPVLGFLTESGMAQPHEGNLAPQVMLTPSEDAIVAADPLGRMQPEPASDVILWPNQTSRLLQNLALREPCASLLDFGAGCGVMSVFAAPFSRQVVATDLNQRSSCFVPFNAWLNGLENIECLIGDTFEPVAGRTFDRILANPPFFVVPSSGVLYCENPMELDGFCRRVVRQGAGMLNEGGFLQMVFEWVQVEGQPWQERLAEWVEPANCDVWVLRTYSGPPASYAHQRCCDQYADLPEAATLKYEEAIAYYRSRNVEEIHGGVLAMRRRSGKNWLRIEEGRIEPARPFGHLVREIFDTQDVLSAGLADGELLEYSPRLSPDASLEQALQVEKGRWAVASFNVALKHALPASLAIDSQIADFLARCDGTRKLAALVHDISAAVRVPPEQVAQQCCAVVRKLAERRILSLAR